MAEVYNLGEPEFYAVAVVKIRDKLYLYQKPFPNRKYKMAQIFGLKAKYPT